MIQKMVGKNGLATRDSLGINIGKAVWGISVIFLACSCTSISTPDLSASVESFSGRWISEEIHDPNGYGPLMALELLFNEDGSFVRRSDNGYGYLIERSGNFLVSEDESRIEFTFDDDDSVSRPYFAFSDDRLELFVKNRETWLVSMSRSDRSSRVLDAMPKAPQDIESAVIELKKNSEPELLREIAECNKEDLVRFHDSIGLYIRNAFELWSGGNSSLLKSCGSVKMHPDDASMIILEALWHNLRSLAGSE